MSQSRRGTKRTEETRKKMSLAQAGENNPMYGKSHTEEKRREIGDKLRGKYVGDKNSQFKGYYVTPFGEFPTVKSAAECVDSISRATIREWCLRPDKKVTKSMIGNSRYLQESDLGKSFKELGFWFNNK